jgi:hypothetical protein
MRISLRFIAFGAALAATPALAQLNVGLGGQGGVNVGVGAGVNVNPGATVGGVTNTLGNTATRLDRTVNGTVNGALDSELRLATAADLRSGATIRDNRGRKVGAIQSVQGNVALVATGGRTVRVPIASLYRSSSGLVTKLSKSQINAMASANANAGASVRN